MLSLQLRLLLQTHLLLLLDDQQPRAQQLLLLLAHQLLGCCLQCLGRMPTAPTWLPLQDHFCSCLHVLQGSQRPPPPQPSLPLHLNRGFLGKKVEA